MGGDRRTIGRSRRKAVPLASLPAPQRRLVAALLEAARSASVRSGIRADGKVAVPMNRTGGRAEGAR